MAITGDGTQANPYKPTTWLDLIGVSTTDSVYIELPKSLEKTKDTVIIPGKLYFTSSGVIVEEPVQESLPNYYENTFAFDLKKLYPEGITLTITLKGYIDGMGATIKNASYRGGTACFEIGSSLKSNLNIINCRGEMTAGFLIGTSGNIPNGTTVFKNCKLSGSISAIGSSTPYFTWIGRYAYFERCSINVRLDNAMLDYALYKNCHINAIINGNQGSGYLQLDNSYLTGKIATLQLQRNSSHFVGESIIDCEATRILWDTGVTQSFLINSDKIEEGTTIPSVLTPVTTAELHDAEYLSSIGFPIET